MSDDNVRICVMQGGKRKCYDIESEIYKGMGLFAKLVIALIVLFVGVFVIVGVLSWLAGSLGFDVINALVLAGMILLLPVSAVFFLWLGIFIYKNIKMDGTVNIIVVILLVILLFLGLIYLYSWAFGEITSLWGTIVDSW